MESDLTLKAFKRYNSVIYVAPKEKLQRLNIKETLEKYIDGIDADNLYDFLEKLMIKSKETEFFELEEKSMFTLNIKNALKLMKYYGKKEIKLANYEFLNLSILEFKKI